MGRMVFSRRVALAAAVGLAAFTVVDAICGARSVANSDKSAASAIPANTTTLVTCDDGYYYGDTDTGATSGTWTCPSGTGIGEYCRKKLVTYEATAICKQIHEDLPPWGRLDADRKEVDSTFAPDDDKYVESVVLTGLPAVLIGILSVLFFTFRLIIKSLVCCCRACGCRSCCCKDPKDDGTPADYNDQANGLGDDKRAAKKHKCLIVILVFSAVIVFAGVAFGYFMNEEVSNGVDETLAAIKSFDDNTAACVNELTDLEGSLTNVRTQALALYADMNTDCSAKSTGTYATCDAAYQAANSPSTDTPLKDVFDIITCAINGLDTNDASTDCSGVTGAVGTISSGKSDFNNINMAENNKDIDDFDQLREYGQLGVLVLLCLPYIWCMFMMACKCCKANCWIRIIVVYTVVIGFLGWIICAVETVAVVFVADMCYDPDTQILEEAQKDSNSTYDMANYYITCEGTTPLQDELDSATGSLTTTETEISNINGMMDGTGSPDLSALFTTGTATTPTTNALAGSVDTVIGDVNQLTVIVFGCNAVHNVYKSALNGLCDTTLKGLSALVIIQGLEAFCCFIAIYAVIVLQKSYKRSLKSQDQQVTGDEKGAAQL